MNRSKSFEKIALRVAVARLRATPKQWASYRRHSRSWLGKVGLGLLRCIGMLGLGMLLLALPLKAGVAIGNGGRDVPFASTLAVLVATSLAFGHSRNLLRELVASRTLAVASQLPISDGDYFSYCLKRMWILSTGSLAASLAYFFGIAVGARLPLGKSGVVVGLGFVEWLIIASLSVIVPSYFPFLQRRRTERLLFGVTFISLLTGFMAGFRKLLAIETVLTWIMAILPTGWPLLMVRNGVVGNTPQVWFFLAGVFLLLVLAGFAIQRMRSSYIISEINFGEHALATAVLKPADHEALDWPTLESDAVEQPVSEGDDEQPFAVTAPRVRGRFWKWIWPAVDDEPLEHAVIEIDADDCREFIRSRSFLTDEPWPKNGWLESSFLNLVDDRQRQVAQIAVGPRVDWSRRVLRAMRPAFVLMLIQMLRGGLGRAGSMIGLMVTVSPAVTLFGSGFRAAIWKSKTGHRVSIAGLLPISVREIMTLSMKLGAVRAAYFAPFVFGTAASTIYGIRGQWDLIAAAVIAAKAALVVVALHQWAFIVQIPTVSPRAWYQYLVSGLIGVPVLLIAPASAVWLFQAGKSEGKSLVAAAVMLGWGWLAQRSTLLDINKNDVDLITAGESDTISSRGGDAPEIKW